MLQHDPSARAASTSPVPDHSSTEVQAVPTERSTLGWNDRWRATFTPWADLHCRPARVVRVDRAACSAIDLEHDELRLATLGHDVTVVGDWVAVTPEGVLAGVLQRASSLQRHAAGVETRAQVVAANIDVVLVTCSLEVALNLRRIERFTALAWQSGARPVVVLTKADLVDGDAVAQLASEAERVAPGVDVVAVSVLEPGGIETIRARLPAGTTVVLLGQSGVGKSSLVNALRGDEVQAVTATRGDGKGRHTTTHRELVELPGGALLIDTPGVRAVRLWDAGEGVAQVFGDIDELAQHCRFHDCGHASEPGCAVQSALAAGTIDEDRFASWIKLRRELAFLARKQDARARIDYGRAIRARSRDIRRNPKQRRS